MKYLILVVDGAADYKIESLGNKTPLEVANLTNINSIAAVGEVGLVQTIPEGIAPGSDAANLAIMGFDPRVYLTGRAPLEAASMGIEMSDSDVAFRCNVVTLAGAGAYEELEMVDHSAGDISTEEARELIRAIDAHFDKAKFYPGVSYRHCMIVDKGDDKTVLTPPHDILTKVIGEYLPANKEIREMMKESYELLSAHSVNIARVEKGLNPANSIWIWGQGKKPQLASFYEKYGVKGVTISAVDLIKGIGVCAGLEAIDVVGATGTLHTNYVGKALAAIRAFEDGNDFVYLHVEGPDECSHQGDLDGKIKSLEEIDAKILKPILDYFLASGEDYRVLVLPDHETPVSMRTHASGAVPYVLYDSTAKKETDNAKVFTEAEATKSGRFFENGYQLADYFFAVK
ncbi:cofactor-independent phosphoglycerate mutase [Candidatus Epulonipiscium viviparus]|uniref:cofactor-independent phosphoglycerate mutase n=1 Tax=Candidatus Epulonipiscium viviparus TaxID=420336 RepID=UPI002738160D|nr:cofactor-independent phosphoglycerate mutase [Candidatus Epulopiscium viviparus]